jgi:hypothetical protein
LTSATLWRSLAGLLDYELPPLNLFLSEQKNFRVSAFVSQLMEHLFEEVDYLPALRGASLFLPPFFTVIERSHILKLQVFFF